MSEYVESFKTIMLATDLSDASYGALSYARRLARQSSAKLLVVHVIDPNAVPSLTDSAEEEMQKIAAALSEDSIRYATIVRQGAIRETILQLVREREVDLLVVGTSGKGHRNGESLGSTAEKLLRAMPCPVLTVGRGMRGDAFDGTHLRRVLFPVDFSNTSRSAVMHAMNVTRYLGGHLLLLHAEESGTDSLNKMAPTGQGAKFEAMLKEIINPPIIDEYITRTGAAAKVIVAVASEKHVDLIVLGVHEGDQSGGTRLHGIAYDVIRFANCPVLTFCPTALMAA